MNKLKKLLTLLLFFIFVITNATKQSHAQDINLDSLWVVWNDESQPDTARLEAMHIIARKVYVSIHVDSAYYFAQLEYDFAKQKGLKKYMADALNTQGVSFTIQGDFNRAIEYYTRSITIQKEISNKKGIANSLNNIGSIYAGQSDYASAIDYYTRSLTIREEIDDKIGVAMSFTNIGLIYHYQGDYTSAIDYYTRSLSIQEKIGDKQGITSNLNNIGFIYYSQNDYANAIDNFTRSLIMQEELGDSMGISNTLTNIGNVYMGQGDYASALHKFTRSLTINEEVGDKSGVIVSLANIGLIYHYQEDYTTAIAYITRALTIAQDLGLVRHTKDAASALYEAYKASGRSKPALEMYELYIEMRDSIESEENQKAVIKQQFKYEYEKQALADSLEFAKEQEVKDLQIREQDAQLKQDRTMKIGLASGGLLFLILAIVAVFAFINKRKDNKKIAAQKAEVEDQKEEVERQKVLVDIKNKEITDSITYAQRIQEAVLPPDRLRKEYLKDSFVLFKPKDIVAGDFYWMEKVGEKIIFAAADCTGHGVPGAMLSMLCNNALNRSLREYGLTDPGKILDKTREIIIQEFEKSDEDVKDGMDISLCVLDSNKLQFAGAYNLLWIIRSGEIIEIKGDRQPIGNSDDPVPFTTHKFNLEKGDVFYIFSDGYVDQFGGEKGKKLKAKAFKALLLSIQDKPMNGQSLILDEAFETWRGDLEQIDDVCVIGVKI